MKKSLSVLLLFISITSFVSSVLASVTFEIITVPSLPFEDDPANNLCVGSCDFTISFPDGGTLTATDILLINFGNGGVINLGQGGSINVSVPPASLSYPSGGTLFLAASESITFGAGGYINTAASGNFKYTDIEVTTDVNIEAALDTGSSQINLFNITATGTGNATISTNGIINVVGTLASTEAGFNLNGVIPDALPRLCDGTCDLTVSFPDGGTLTATEALRIYFGAGGLIDLGITGTVNAATQPGTLEFPAGGSLVLDAGESITFDVGGSIKTASGGNFSYTDIEVTTDVDFNVVLDEGSTSIDLYDITVTGNGVITITADGVINLLGMFSLGDASLVLNAGSEIIVTDNTGETTAECSSTSIGGSNIMLSSSVSVVYSGTNCIGTILLDGAISIDATAGGDITLTDVAVIDLGDGQQVISEEINIDDVQPAPSKEDGAGAIDWMTFLFFAGLGLRYRRSIFSIR